MDEHPEIDLLLLGTGSVTAPAGHGKTQVIASTIEAHPESKVLVLTHTNAGVNSLRRRVSSGRGMKTSRIETLSSLALRVSRSFPDSVGWVEGDKIDHKFALDSCVEIFDRSTVRKAFASSYGAVIVDEYQDCSEAHHALIKVLAQDIPVSVLGDPMQAIFDFDSANPMVAWADVERDFPSLGQLGTPHRWADTDPALGAWLADTRIRLLADHGIAVGGASVVRVAAIPKTASQGGLANHIPPSGSVAIIIGDSARSNSLSGIANKLGGRVSVLEAVEMIELTDAAATIADTVDNAHVLLELIRFAAITTTAVGSAKVKTVARNLEKSGTAGMGSGPIAEAARMALKTGLAFDFEEFLAALINGPGCNIYRPDLLYVMRRALRSMTDSSVEDISAACRSVLDARKQESTLNRRRCMLGTTLRMKGLEYDHVILLDPASVPSKEHLYVALSRARSTLTIALAPDQGLGRWSANN